MSSPDRARRRLCELLEPNLWEACPARPIGKGKRGKKIKGKIDRIYNCRSTA